MMMLTHFYDLLFFEDWKQDLWTRRFVRDYLRYIDEIPCAAARVVEAVKQKSRVIDGNNPDGLFDSKSLMAFAYFLISLHCLRTPLPFLFLTESAMASAIASKFEISFCAFSIRARACVFLAMVLVLGAIVYIFRV